MKRFARVLGCWAVAGLIAIGSVHGAEKTGFWIALRSNVTIDRQVAEEIGPRANMIALRAPSTGPATGYSYPEIVARLKRGAPGVPVLAYARVSRVEAQGRIESYILRDLDAGRFLAETKKKGNPTKYFDLTDPAVRRAIIERLIHERKRLGVDGFAIDVAHRTPIARPKPLAQICDNKPVFCEVYAKSMDEIFGTLNTALGEPGTLLYNGIWNFDPGMVEDQSRLLLYADAAAVEFFGMNPRVQPRGFREEILPYLDVVSRLPKGKPLLFFGRGPWRYTDYAVDYRWQRYLFGSFLLARRAEDMFKYHSSFQVPAHAGRAGGLDVYADRNIDLGSALGPYRVEAGLYQREFSRGRVIVAPDDGRGGRLRITATYYTPEGQAVSGDVDMGPGEALILLNTKTATGEADRRITARMMAAWGWTRADLVRSAEGERLRLSAMPAGLEWEHDVWLDMERSLVPFERLEINAVLADPTSALLAVAEVDDPKGEHMQVVVAVQSSGSGARGVRVREAVQFRAHHRESENWPWISVSHVPSAKSSIVLDGPKVFAATEYRFRRWSHVRLMGAMQVSAIVLDRRPPVPINVRAGNSASQAVAGDGRRTAQPGISVGIQ